MRTNIKQFIPVLTMGLMSLISYLDRSTLAVLAPTILKDTHLSAEQYGYIVSAFSIAYMLGNPAWGWLIDRFGTRWVAAWAVLLWTLASTAHAFIAAGAAAFAGFLLARATLGFGEGATFPSGLRTADQTLPPRLRSRGIAVAYSGGSLGALVTPLIVTPIAASYGWRAAFLFTGLAGAFWIILWLTVNSTQAAVRSESVVRGFLNRNSSPAPRVVASGETPSWKDRRLWAYVVLYAFGALPLAFPLYAAPIYLAKVMHLSQSTIGHLLWLPPLGWEIGYFTSAWICDRLITPRNMPAWLGLFALICGGSLGLAPYAGSLPAVMGLLTTTMLGGGSIVVIAVRYGSNAFRARSGFIAGTGAASWSAVVAVVMPYVGRLFDQNRYSFAFTLIAACSIAGTAGWRLLAGEPALPQDSERLGY